MACHSAMKPSSPTTAKCMHPANAASAVIAAVVGALTTGQALARAVRRLALVPFDISGGVDEPGLHTSRVRRDGLLCVPEPDARQRKEDREQRGVEKHAAARRRGLPVDPLLAPVLHTS